MKYNSRIAINNKFIGINDPTYFIADIASNHNGSLDKAKELIFLAKEAGADAVKFQHFKANNIVSDLGFQNLKGDITSHQSSWKQSVFEVFKKYECNDLWNLELKKTADEVGVDFFSTPYDYLSASSLADLVPCFKIGSGDITWIDFIVHLAKMNKPLFIATGASDISDVLRSVDAAINYNPNVILMQCNTNYTGSYENFKYINLRVLTSYSLIYPQMILGLSDHSLTHSTTLGAIALGARAVEKHFTDNRTQGGPDHGFSLDPALWREMIDRSRELEASLGNGVKKVEANEIETSILQQRCIRLITDLPAGSNVGLKDLQFLRPATPGGLRPYEVKLVIGKKLKGNKNKEDPIFLDDLEDQ